MHIDDAQVASELVDPAFHLDVLDELVYPAECGGAVPLASDPDNRYPYAYPRDIASITKAWLAAIDAGVRPTECCQRILDSARFLLAVQEESGQWRQRYALDGTDKGFYRQEDNVGHGVRILAHAISALDETERLDGVEDSLRRSIVDAIDRATAHIESDLFDPNAHLVKSTTSIHEGRIESGYTLWVNCTMIAALRRARDALSRVPEDTDALDERLSSFGSHLEAGVERAFTSTRELPRRYSPDGDIDVRPDVTLFAPFYFNLEDLFGDQLHGAIDRASTALEDPELGGLQRFMGFYGDFDVQHHGGNGPWMQYTAWHAQYRFAAGELERGDRILETIARYADREGYIPEHLTTRTRFEAFFDEEWNTRRDFEKEFDDATLRDVSFDLIAEELSHMKNAYRDLEAQTDERDAVRFAMPLAWCHAEFLTALFRRASSVEDGAR
ncbi:glucoamylase [Halegenticoccus tardaugens]|uniref:glucoamylase n=1 Tax=Halegenticoccus tardaugens TaxID=2071624 RepID=UPI00100BDC54|nr:glucoamylase [Halegenticoccus tardaugens]